MYDSVRKILECSEWYTGTLYAGFSGVLSGTLNMNNPR